MWIALGVVFLILMVACCLCVRNSPTAQSWTPGDMLDEKQPVAKEEEMLNTNFTNKIFNFDSWKSNRRTIMQNEQNFFKFRFWSVEIVNLFCHQVQPFKHRSGSHPVRPEARWRGARYSRCARSNRIKLVLANVEAAILRLKRFWNIKKRVSSRKTFGVLIINLQCQLTVKNSSLSFWIFDGLRECKRCTEHLSRLKFCSENKYLCNIKQWSLWFETCTDSFSMDMITNHRINSNVRTVFWKVTWRNWTRCNYLVNAWISRQVSILSVAPVQ